MGCNCHTNDALQYGNKSNSLLMRNSRSPFLRNYSEINSQRQITNQKSGLRNTQATLRFRIMGSATNIDVTHNPGSLYFYLQFNDDSGGGWQDVLGSSAYDFSSCSYAWSLYGGNGYEYLCSDSSLANCQAGAIITSDPFVYVSVRQNLNQDIGSGIILSVDINCNSNDFVVSGGAIDTHFTVNEPTTGIGGPTNNNYDCGGFQIAGPSTLNCGQSGIYTITQDTYQSSPASSFSFSISSPGWRVVANGPTVIDGITVTSVSLTVTAPNIFPLNNSLAFLTVTGAGDNCAPRVSTILIKGNRQSCLNTRFPINQHHIGRVIPRPSPLPSPFTQGSNSVFSWQ